MDDIIEKNMGLVASVVNSFKPKNHVEKEDYMQAGRIGLWKALKKHDPSKAALSTYAWNPIRWEIIKEIKSIKADRYCSISDIRIPEYKIKSEFWENYPNNHTEEECELIDLRRMGYTLEEISNIAGRARSYVKRRIYTEIQKKTRTIHILKIFKSCIYAYNYFLYIYIYIHISIYIYIYYGSSAVL